MPWKESHKTILALLINARNSSGPAFSIILHKEFYTFGNHNGGIDISTRMMDLLGMLSLEDRYVVNNDFISGEPINYKDIEKKLGDHRKESIEFLKKALGGCF